MSNTKVESGVTVGRSRVGRPRKVKQYDQDGKSLRRLTFIVSERDYGIILSTIMNQIGQLPLNEYIDHEEECQSRAIVAICEKWLATSSV